MSFYNSSLLRVIGHYYFPSNTIFSKEVIEFGIENLYTIIRPIGYKSLTYLGLYALNKYNSLIKNLRIFPN